MKMLLLLLILLSFDSLYVDSLYITTNSVLFHYWSFAFVYSGADRKNLSALRRPHPLNL